MMKQISFKIIKIKIKCKKFKCTEIIRNKLISLFKPITDCIQHNFYRYSLVHSTNNPGKCLLLFNVKTITCITMIFFSYAVVEEFGQNRKVQQKVFYLCKSSFEDIKRGQSRFSETFFFLKKENRATFCNIKNLFLCQVICHHVYQQLILPS